MRSARCFDAAESSSCEQPFPASMRLTPISRCPTVLPEATVRTVLAQPETRPTVVTGSDSRRSETASIVIVTFNGLVYTKMCLETVLGHTRPGTYEVVVVDNGSSDGTADYLERQGTKHSHVRVVRNDDNRGFAPATNQGLAQASGDILILLNNDTLVPPGWLDGLRRHLSDRGIGLVGPVTNRICNEAEIHSPYATYGEFMAFAQERAASQGAGSFDIRMLAMFCMAMRRDVYEAVGLLDERFEIGTLEDEDYSIRARRAGYRVVCAEDVFVHHFDKASFGHLVSSGEYARLLEGNTARFEAKWGITWEPYRRRPKLEYEEMVQTIRDAVCQVTPVGATIAVISKGDDNLVKFADRRGWHFPQMRDGTYAGHYPADSADCISQLEQLRQKGAEYLVIPATAFWWLEHYPAWCTRLQARASLTAYDEHCRIVQLCGEAGQCSDGIRTEL